MDNMMPGMYSDPADIPEWDYEKAYWCEICKSFYCDCDDVPETGGMIWAAKCPNCRELVFPNDEDMEAHCAKGCERYVDEPDFYLWGDN